MSGCWCFLELCSTSSSHLQTGMVPFPPMTSVANQLCMASKCQCVCKMRGRLIISSNLVSVHGSTIYHSRASYIHPSPSLAPNNQSILSPPLICPSNISISTLSDHDISYLNYPIIFSWHPCL